jgi:hypothetical protein
MFPASSSGEEMEKAALSAQRAALDQLWKIEYDPDLDDRSSGGDIEIRFDGSAANYLRARAGRAARGA